MTAEAPARTRQVELRERADALFPGGVNSPVRAFRAVGREPILLREGRGAYVWDADGRRYLDLIGSWGAALLGHADPAVVAAVRAAAEGGFALGATHPLEIELGEAIRAAMPAIERLRFTSSGTEAVMSAVRLARAATGRDLVVKFAGAYHGHSDGLLVEAGSGVATLAIPGSAGVPAAVAATTIVLPFNDLSAATLAFAEHAGRIAAVVVEPVVANAGVIGPVPGFLEHLRQLTRADGALLVFDEVITGFRLGPGGAQGRFRVQPDLTTLGKVIGGGMPIGAYGGRADLMALVAPEGAVYQAGTLSGHPLAMAAGVATLRQLGEDRYAALEGWAEALAERLADAATGAGRRDVAIARVGPLLTVFFRPTIPTDAAEALASDRDAYARFFGGMLDAGVLLPPSPFEAWFPGFAHGQTELDAIAAAAERAFRA
ncbi:MAG TPA: glutamate-1-semialdehyde 2,1-aminomutase [Candidatus Limnocylindrales bacterium]|nr:glutamate-1-semialdehyde 2,1-aminomutase [Candidatus Limnocylindrales bacterium]